MAILLLGIILNWAVRQGLLKENPARHFKLAPVGTRDVILENADDYARLFKTLERMEEELRLVVLSIQKTKQRFGANPRLPR